MCGDGLSIGSCRHRQLITIRQLQISIFAHLFSHLQWLLLRCVETYTPLIPIYVRSILITVR